MTIKALLFDKDGTLFHFGKTWNAWAASTIMHFSNGDGVVAKRIADEIQYDLVNKVFSPNSPVIAGTNREAAELFAGVLTDRDVSEIERFLSESAAQAPLSAAVDLPPFLSDCRARGLKLGVMTNDTEFGALAHLKSAAVAMYFDMIIGADSGFGAKPDPDPLLAFARAVQIDPQYIAMIGDSTHDLIAGRAAGMHTIGVLSGMAKASELAPWADTVLPDIGHIPAYLHEQNAE